MATFINNRIYLECETNSPDSYMNEMMRVIEMGLDKHVIIWDQSRQEEKSSVKDLFDVHVSPCKVDNDGNKVFDRNIWAALVEYNLRRTKFLKIGCWKKEFDLINEVKSACKISGTEEYGEQIGFSLELNDLTKQYLINRYLNSDRNVKWFDLVLYSADDENSCVFISNHYGNENYIFKLTEEEVEKVIITVENNDIYVRINRHKSNTCGD